MLKRISPVEMHLRRKKGLCFICDEQFCLLVDLKIISFACG